MNRGRFALNGRARTALLFISAAGYLASFSDLGGPLQAEMLPDAKRAAVLVDLERDAALPSLASLIRRDPFAGVPRPRRLRNAPRWSDPPNEPLVPDIDPGAAGELAAAAPAPETLQVAVRATITGAHPVAYVAEGADLQIVRVGDIVAGRRVAAIDLRGLALSDGLRVDLPESYLPTPQPAAASEPDLQSALSELARSRRGFHERAAPPAPALTPAAAPAAAIPAEAGAPAPAAPSASTTPAPMRTVDSRGIAPGVNPTPDLVDPTAFPYPYPYPPPH